MSKIVSLLTYNICPDPFKLGKRLNIVSDILDDKSPDIICLQGVTDSALQELFKKEWTSEYYFSNRRINRPHGEVSFSKYPIMNSENFQFKTTTQGNCMNVFDVSIPINDGLTYGEEFTIVNAELENLPHYSDYRKDQIFSTMNMLSSKKDCFLLADTKFTDQESDSVVLPSYWHDTYDVLSKQYDLSDLTYTYDSEKNNNISGHDQFRSDRIIYKTNNWVPIMMELVGTTSINTGETDTEKLFPSDHFGVYTEFQNVNSYEN